MGLISQITWAAERALYAAGNVAERVAKARRPSSIKLTQFSTQQTSRWPVTSIQTALDLHEDGDFSESSVLVRAFGRDDRISACRNTRIRALIGRNGATFQLKPSDDGDQRRAGAVRDRIDKLWFQVATEAALTHVLGSVIDLGPAIARIHWVRTPMTGKQWVPVLEPWSLDWVRWDQYKRCYITQTEEGEVEVRGGTGEWLVIEPTGSQSWLSGGVRALSMPWYFRGMTWKDWARYCEKHGVPILAIDEPNNDNDAGKTAAKDKFYASLKKMGREGVLRLPRSRDGKSGYGARIVEPKTLSYPAFEAFLTRLDVCIAIYYLGQNLSTEVKSGSFAAAVAQNRVRLDYLAADAEALSTALREQVWMPWGRFNFDWWDDALASWPTWNTSEPEDTKSRSVVVLNLTKALEQLWKAGVEDVDVRELCTQFNVPLLDKQEVEKRKLEAEQKAKEAEQSAPKTDEPAKTEEKTPEKDEGEETDDE